MQQTIQYFYKPWQPVSTTFVRGYVLHADLETLLTDADRTAVKLEWASLEKTHPGIFSKPKGLGSLYEVLNDADSLPVLLYRSTDFKTYISTSRLADRGTPLPGPIQNAMRISAVGCAVKLVDGSVLIHRRPSNATHVPDKYDAGVAGLAHVQPDHTLNFVQAVHAKFARELNIDPSYLDSLRLISVHSGSAPDFSGMVDFEVHLPLTFGQIKERANPAYLQDMVTVPKKHLPDYLIRNFVASDDLIADGCAVLLSSLSHQTFLKTVERLNSLGRRVSFGTLNKGVFEGDSVFP